MDKLLISIHAGSLFMLVFVVSPVLLRTKDNKNLAGRFYGKILWRYYPIAFLLLLLYFITSDARVYAAVLILLLSMNLMVSKWLKSYKRTLGDIDLIPYDDPKRVLFRRVSLLSTFLLFLNFCLSIYALIRL